MAEFVSSVTACPSRQSADRTFSLVATRGKEVISAVIGRISFSQQLAGAVIWTFSRGSGNWAVNERPGRTRLTKLVGGNILSR